MIRQLATKKTKNANKKDGATKTTRPEDGEALGHTQRHVTTLTSPSLIWRPIFPFAACASFYPRTAFMPP